MTFKKHIQEAVEKHGVLAYGRMNPPTAGHEKVINKVNDVAKAHNAIHKVVLSHTTGNESNPLSPESKLKHAKHAFPGTNISVATKEKPTILHHAAEMYKSGVKHLHVVAGSDRVDEYHKLLHKYNTGESQKHGAYKFKSITVHSSGERDPDAAGSEGISGTKMREHAAAGNKKAFHSGLPKGMKPEHKEALYHDLRKSMNIKEVFDPHLKVSEYQWGEKKGVDKMKSMTPGEKKVKSMKESSTSLYGFKSKLPYLLMNEEQKQQVQEAASQLEFEKVETKHLELYPEAFKMPSETAQEKMYRQHQELRKKRGLPDPEHYKKIAQQKQKEIEAMKEDTHLQERVILDFKGYIQEKLEPIDDINEEEINKIVEDTTWDDIVDLYDPAELVEDDELEEALSAQSRLKKRQAFMRGKSKRNAARGLKLRRASSPEVLKRRAISAARRAVYKRILRGRDKSNLSASEKSRIEQQVSKMKNMQAVIVTKMMPKIRSIEQSRLAHYRGGK